MAVKRSRGGGRDNLAGHAARSFLLRRRHERNPCAARVTDWRMSGGDIVKLGSFCQNAHRSQQSVCYVQVPRHQACAATLLSEPISSLADAATVTDVMMVMSGKGVAAMMPGEFLDAGRSQRRKARRRLDSAPQWSAGWPSIQKRSKATLQFNTIRILRPGSGLSRLNRRLNNPAVFVFVAIRRPPALPLTAPTAPDRVGSGAR